MSTARRKIGIIGPQSHLDTIPSFRGLVQTLADHGYDVDIYMCAHERYPQFELPDESLRVFILPEKYRQGQERWRWRWQYVTQWLPYLTQQCHHEQYDCLIGVEPWGLLLSTVAAKITRIPVIYFSLELYLWRELHSPYLKALKLLERQCNRRAAFLIIQDKGRARLLMSENGIPADRIELLPNAPTGEAKVERTDTLRRALGIAEGRPIALYLGGIPPWVLSLELAQQARNWDWDGALVFHTRGHLTGEYATAFRQQIDGRKTYLSAEPVAGGQVRDLVGSADIGLASYCDSERDRKTFHMGGKSSGKIAHYLQCGLPVVATGLPTVQPYVEGHRCGICVDRVDQVESALKTILSDYSKYSENALVCFEAEFDLNRHVVPILDRLDKLLA